METVGTTGQVATAVAASLAAPLAAAMRPRAAAFIVTLYGDVIDPRGGDAWVGSIIDGCSGAGISETLVRTAVSRLVAAGQLEGWRRGRRSYYRLTAPARAEFDAAARLIYGPPDEVAWRFLHVPEAGAEQRMAGLEQQGYARLRPQLAVGPARGPVPRGCLGFDAQPAGETGLLPEFAAQAWDLDRHATAYRQMLDLFAPVESVAAHLAGPEALAVRLLLVHAWRGVLLRDPRLPPEALPGDWPGHAARALFGRLYGALSQAADSAVGARLEGSGGRLPTMTETIRIREANLARAKKTPTRPEVAAGSMANT